MSIGQHIIIRPGDSRPIFTNLEVRRLFSAKVVQIGEPFDVVGWGAGDDHGHVGNLNEDRAVASELARRLESSLTQELGLGCGFARAKVKVIEDQSHLYSTLPYILRQGTRHGVRCDPFHEGSSLPDAAGLRLVAPHLPARLAEVAPRFDARRLLPELGDPPAPDDAEAWAAAAAAMLGCARLVGQSPLVCQARRLVVELASEASTADLCAALACTPRTVPRLRSAPPAPPVLRQAMLGQARWRATATMLAA